MKHIINSLFIALASIVFLSGCKKENDKLGTMTATINSYDFNAATCSITRTGTGTYLIKGNATSKEHINIILQTSDLVTTTYTLDDTLTTHQASYYDGTTSYSSGNGTVTLTAVSNDKVSGTFIFRHIPSGTVVVNGKFTAVY